MNTIHDVTSLSQTPCVGRCSTSMAPFDEICQGCGRTVEEIRDWNTYSDLRKKMINISNYLDYDIRQKREYKEMTTEKKISDINGRLTTTQALIEMVSQDLLDLFGKDPSIKETYQALYEAREKILVAKQKTPIALEKAS